MEKMINFIVEDGYNTSYMDSVFVALFYKTSYPQNILAEQVDDMNILYLQDLIYYYFVKNMRLNYTINSQIMNEIRNWMVICRNRNSIAI